MSMGMGHSSQERHYDLSVATGGTAEESKVTGNLLT
jgi:hypothetical protein